jgi:hypothetical protein
MDVMMDGRAIEIVRNMKYLGVHIDDKLNFKTHSEQTIKNMGKKVGLLCRLSSILSLNSEKLVYNTIVRPHIVYCATRIYPEFGKLQSWARVLLNQ